ncbi:MAG: peptidase S41 [Idiomarina sp.]|nr:peptidase S41 [Idiomarina sp.]
MNYKVAGIALMSLGLASCNFSWPGNYVSALTSSEASCSQAQKNIQFFDFMQNDYFWNDRIPSGIQPVGYPSLSALLNDMKIPEDNFSFIISEQEYLDRFVNAVFFGFGFGRRDRVDLGVMQIRYVYENSPADEIGLRRGDEITAVNGRSVAEWYQRIMSGASTFEDMFGPNEEGVRVDVSWRRPDGTQLSANMDKRQVEANTVMATERFEVDGRDVGYFVFDTFVNRSEADLNAAYDALDGVDELVIDLRYNGGGLIRVANQLASQAAWDSVENEVFLTYLYNANYQPDTIRFNLGQGITRLNVDRVYVLTTGASCSASELVINALTPFVEVHTIGERTCGKPVGQRPAQICDEIAFTINFQTVNAEGFGDYFDGLPVTCPANDTIVGDWGNPNDPLLATALHHLREGSCPGGATAQQFEPLQQSPVTPRYGHPLLDKFRTDL